MWIIEETVSVQTAAFRGFSSSMSQAQVSDSTLFENAEGAQLVQNGTSSGSTSGSESYTYNPSEGTVNVGSNSFSYSDSGSSDSNRVTVGATSESSEYGGPSATEVDSGRTVTDTTISNTNTNQTLALQTTAQGTGGSSYSRFAGSILYITSVPTLTTTSSGTLTGVGTTISTVTSTSLAALGDASHLLNGTYGTSTSAASPYVSVRTKAVVFAPNEDAWVMNLGSSFSGMSELSNFAQHVMEGSYLVPSSTLYTTTFGLVPTSTLVGVQQGLATGVSEITQNYLVSATSSESVSELLLPLAEMPNSTAKSTFNSAAYSNTEFSEGVVLNQVISSTAEITGASTSSTGAAWYDTTLSIPDLAYDSRGRITGSSALVERTASSTITSCTYAVQNGGGDAESNTLYTADGYASAFGETGVTTTTSATQYFSATSFLPYATILEATFDPAVRFGISGKFDSIDGPGGSVFYPFWSQVWHGLWMPITYAAGQTTTYQNQSIVTETYPGGSYSYPSATGPTISASYSWSGSQVSMTTATSVAGVTGSNSIATGTTQFAMHADGEDDVSYYVTSNTGLGGPEYVAGGTQWADQSAQLWLGSGIWSLTSYDASGGSSTDKITVTDLVSISMVPTSIVVAARPIPTWECVSADPGDPCLAVFTQSN